MNRLLNVAQFRGVEVAWRDLGTRNGEYHHDQRLIVLNPTRTTQAQRVVLAHELGHAHYGHVWTDHPHQHHKQERLADEVAASLLICAGEYIRAERTVGPHPGALAKELGVTRSIIEAWRTMARRYLAVAA